MNHSFVTVKGSLSKDNIHYLIIKINEEFFKNIFTVTRHTDNYWEIQFKNEWQYKIGITIDNKRKLHLRPSLGKFSGWIETIFQNEIAFELNGNCSCEAFNEKWKPVKNKYPTFRNYWDAIHDNFEFIDEKYWGFLCNIFEKEIETWPDELKQFAGEFPNSNILPKQG